MDKSLVVMAAGMGSRFGGLKQIEPVGPNGEFIVDYSVYDAKRAGFNKVVFVIKKELENVFKETIGRRLEGKIKVEYAFQEISDIPEDKKYLAEIREKPWGTAQAVFSAKDYVQGDFVVINADDFYGYDSYLKASKFLDNSHDNNEYACITYPISAVSSKYGSVKRGICYLNGDNITRMIESKVELKGGVYHAEALLTHEEFDIDNNHPVSMNMFAFKNNLFDYLNQFLNEYFRQDDNTILSEEALLPELLKEKLEAGEITLKNVVSNGLWFGITYRGDLDILKENIKKLIEKGDYPEKLWE